jgi:hypothetical protein
MRQQIRECQEDRKRELNKKPAAATTPVSKPLASGAQIHSLRQGKGRCPL